MKHLFFCSFLFLCTLSSRAQVFEHSYTNVMDARMVQLTTGTKYLVRDDTNKQLRLYNLDHSLYKTINVPQFPGYICDMAEAAYVSDHLFNLDNLIEYVVYYDPAILMVINENGTILDSIPHSYDFLPHIYADENGHYKLMARHHGDKISVYGLPGYMLCVPTCGEEQE